MEKRIVITQPTGKLTEAHEKLAKKEAINSITNSTSFISIIRENDNTLRICGHIGQDEATKYSKIIFDLSMDLLKLAQISQEDNNGN